MVRGTSESSFLGRDGSGSWIRARCGSLEPGDSVGNLPRSGIILPIDMFDSTRWFDTLSGSFTDVVTDRRGQR